ncbi:MAG: tripartite tricarboxylate transporter substrate binding protein [Burkholderiales bacterium]
MQSVGFAGLSLAALIATSAAAQPTKETAAALYPDKPIRLIVPFTPAGTADIFARAVGQKLGERWNQQVVIDNRAGSAGIIGSEIAAKAPPDGHTLMIGITANIAINPALYAKLPYDANRDFAPVTLIAKAPYLMVITPALPVKSVQDFIAFAKSRPGQMNYASTGSGSAGHLTAELFASMAGVKLVHIPYKTSAAHVVDMISGQVQLMFSGIVSAQPHIQSGKLRAIGITGAQRSPLMPELRTVSESGVRGFEVVGWYGVFAPAGTPHAIVGKLNAEIVRILKLPEVGERLASEGAELSGNTPEEFGAYVKTEQAKWAKVVRISGARVH